jgi:hypothetical protein
VSAVDYAVRLCGFPRSFALLNASQQQQQQLGCQHYLRGPVAMFAGTQGPKQLCLLLAAAATYRDLIIR